MKFRRTLALCAIGVAAYMLTDIIHEALGHGGGCLLLGNKIDLIQSVYFRSHPGSWLTDIAGPLANLFAGILIFIMVRSRQTYISLFWLTLMAFNFFWFSGTILESGFSKSGDWVFAMKEWIPGAMGKPVLLAAGVIAYLISVSIIRGSVHKAGEQASGSFPYVYIAAVIAATVTGACYSPDRLQSALGGLLEAIGLLPVLFVASGKENNLEDKASGVGLTLPGVVFFLFLVFCITLGRGI